MPRLLAEFAAALSLDQSASFFAWSSALVVACLGVAVYCVTGQFLHSTGVRAALATGLIVLPIGQSEVFNNTANLHWFLLFATAWGLLWRTDSAWTAVAATALVLLGTLSSPFTAVYAPLAIARVLILHGWRAWTVVIAWAVGVVAQAVTFFNPSVTRQLVGEVTSADVTPVFDVALLIQHYAFHVLARGVLGSVITGDGRGLRGLTATAGAALIIMIAIVAWARYSDRRNLTLCIAAVIASAVTFSVPWVLNGGLVPPRYTVAPVLFLYAALALLADDVVRDRLTVKRTVVAQVAVMLTWLLLLAVVGTNYRVWTERSEGPSWSTELATARTICGDTGVSEVDVPVFPSFITARLRCVDLLTDSSP